MLNSIYSCMKCGTCTGSCPSGRVVSFRTRQLVEAHCLGEIDLDDVAIWYCTTCYNCMERCPRNIDITDDILRIREEAYKQGKVLPQHKDVMSYIYRTGHAVPINEEIKDLRESLGLSRIPPTTYKFEEALGVVRLLLEEGGFNDE